MDDSTSSASLTNLLLEPLLVPLGILKNAGRYPWLPWTPLRSRCTLLRRLLGKSHVSVALSLQPLFQIEFTHSLLPLCGDDCDVFLFRHGHLFPGLHHVAIPAAGYRHASSIHVGHTAIHLPM